MKTRVFTVLSLAIASITMVSCIDDQATNEVILANDKAAINAYVDTTSIVNAKEIHDEATGLRMIWQELAPSDTIETFYLADTVTVNYTGKFLTDEVFETTLESVAIENGIYDEDADYEPVEFILGGVILGFQYGISNMEIGEKATVFVPSEFAYGRSGSGPIPPNTPLIFEIELVKVNPVEREP